MDRFLKVLDFSSHGNESQATAPAPPGTTPALLAAPLYESVDNAHTSLPSEALQTSRGTCASRHLAAIKDEPHLAKAVRLLWCDTGGIRRCRVVPGRRYAGLQSSGLGITTACMAMPAYADTPAPGAGLTAVGEARMVPVESTRVALPWCPGHHMALVEFEAPRHESPWDCCPRRALRNTIKMLLDNFGLTLKVGFELEFLLLERCPPDDRSGLYGTGWRPVEVSLYCQSSAMNRQAKVLDEMVDALEAMGVEVVQWHPESAPGQYEIALMYCDPLEAADKLLLAKEAIVGVAECHGLAVSYLPKPSAAAGNGLHVHMSLWKDGKAHMHIPNGGDSQAAIGLTAAAIGKHHHSHTKGLQQHHSQPPPPTPQQQHHHHHTASSSAFQAPQSRHSLSAPLQGPPLTRPLRSEDGTATPLHHEDRPRISPSNEMLSFLAGLLEYLDVLLPFTAPSPNSYHRLQPGAWAGAHAAWGYNNREVPLRVTAPGPNKLEMMHIEYKAMDGTANPYLALSSIIVAGMLGIFSQLVLPEPCQVPPADLETEAAARLGVRPLPTSLDQALAKLQTGRTGEAFRAAMMEAISPPLLQAYLAVRQAEAGQARLDKVQDMLLRYS